MCYIGIWDYLILFHSFFLSLLADLKHGPVFTFENNSKVGTGQMIKDNRTVYGVIYLVINKINNKIYVGQTVGSFQDRYRGDIAKNTHNEHLRRAINKYGIDNFYIVEEYKVAYSQEELDYLEDWYITIYDTMNPSMGYNKRGGGSNGRLSEESKQKMSESRKGKFIGELHPFYGKTHSEESKKKISESLKGKPSNTPKTPVIMLDKTTGNPLMMFDAISDTDIYFNKTLAFTNIIKCCKGKRKSSQGYKWMYLSDFTEQHPDFNIDTIPVFNPEELTVAV